MSAPLHGTVHGSTVELDAPVPALEGRRVLVMLEVVDELGANSRREVWDSWVAHGPQGPIEDEGEPEFP
jgi:hypothetical protein